MPSDNLPPGQSAARRAFLTPAHPAGGTGILPVTKREGEAPAEPSASITQLKITPQTLGFSTNKAATGTAAQRGSCRGNQLSRRERRRLRRLAKSK